jgi:hypothetical protein
MIPGKESFWNPVLMPTNHKLNQLQNPNQTEDELINNFFRGR